MESTYLNNADFWRQKAPTPDGLKSNGLDVNMSVYPMSPYELDQIPGVFTFAACQPNPFKELAVLKEKGPHDIADALLSLKHPVVHPNFTGSLSPVSNGPTTTHPLQSVIPSNFTSPPSPQPLYYTPQMLSPPYSNSSHGQYPHPQYSQDPPFSPHPSQQNMFPAMSVNVSMSMNVGVPPNLGGGNQYNPTVYHHQWADHPQHCYPNNGSALPSQYNSYSQQNPYKPYSLGSDIRAMQNERDYFYKSTDSFKEAARIYSSSHLKRARILRSNGRGQLTPTPEPAKVNLCRICGKTYARPSTLKTHLRTHSGEKPYNCPTCSKSFSQAANLTAHIRTHSGEKPFRCPICDRRFSQSSSVTTHMRTHSGERPYRCRLCKKAFSDSSTLTKHLRIHSGEKPYQCKLCMLRFSQSGNLNRHMRVHNNSS